MKNTEIFEKFVECGKNFKVCVLCTIVEESGSTPRGVGASMLVFEGGKIEGTIGGGITEHNVIKRASQMMETGEEFFLFREELTAEKDDETAHLHAACGGTLRVFMQSARVPYRLVIFGAGHVGRAIAESATFAGFDVTTWDEREEFANERQIPFGKTVCCPLDEVREKINFSSTGYIVIVTRGHALDAEVIKRLEHVPARYIGVIGSKTKIAYVKDKLQKEGVSAAYLDGLHQPIGLPIRAETPEEIAISVVAEMIAVRHGVDVAWLRKAWGD